MFFPCFCLLLYFSSIPHGARSIIVAAIATFAFAFSLYAQSSCQFLKSDFTDCDAAPEASRPPEPLSTYAFCGECHCINGEAPCPTGDAVPETSFSPDIIAQFRSLVVTNPYDLMCDPYNETNCTTTPPQTLTELGTEAVCAIKYDTTLLDDNQCPIQYRLETYTSKDTADADGAFLTHWGACGVCSTTQDLATYIEYPDLTTKGTECSIRGIRDFDDGIACYEEVGYTEVRYGDFPANARFFG